jgi:hypothetical protein
MVESPLSPPPEARASENEKNIKCMPVFSGTSAVLARVCCLCRCGQPSGVDLEIV